MLGALRVLPESCLAHALLFLNDLDDLLCFASTNAAAHAFVLAHWPQLKPDGAAQRRKFLAQLQQNVVSSSIPPTRLSNAWFHLFSTPVLPPLPPLAAAARQEEHRVVLGSGSRHSITGSPFEASPFVAGTVLITSMQITARWKEDLGTSVEVIVGGACVARLHSLAVMQMADAATLRSSSNDGTATVDVIQCFLHRLPLHLMWHEIAVINNSRNAFSEVEICWTEHHYPNLLAATNDERVQWQMHELTEPESATKHISCDTVLFRNVTNFSNGVDYLGIIVLEKKQQTTDPRKTSLHMPLIERFILTFYEDNNVRQNNKRQFEILGSACRVAGGGGYKVPLDGLDFGRCIFNYELEVKFRNPLPEQVTVVSYACARRVAIEMCGMMGVLM